MAELGWMEEEIILPCQRGEGLNGGKRQRPRLSWTQALGRKKIVAVTHPLGMLNTNCTGGTAKNIWGGGWEWLLPS